MKSPYRNAISLFSDSSDSEIGKLGIKTDIYVKIAPGTVPIIIASIVVALIIGNIASNAIIKAISK